MNISSNPWSFVNGDINTAAITSIALNADGTVTLTCTASPGTPYTAQQGITVVGVTNAAYNGFYRVLIQTSTTVYQLAPQFSIPAGTASSSGGNVYRCQYSHTVRIEDIQWQNAPVSGSLTVYDRNGNIVWTATTPANAGANPPNYNRGKIFWVQGFTLAALTAGGSGATQSTILVTVN